MPEKVDKKILEKKIEAWKNKLIDLSRRNRLLNFRTTKVTTLKIIDELPSEVFKSMVVENNSFHFLPKEEDTKELFKDNESTQINEQESEFHEYTIEELEEKHTDSNLQTNLTNERLLKNLKRIQFRANQLMEEQGYNILYLTLGMLEWYEADQSDVKNRSPIIMLPVELKKRSINSKYKLFSTDEEPFVNPTLQYKMNSEFNLSIPELQLENDSFEPMDYFKNVNKLIKSNERWKITNEIFLGLFSFAKFVMYKDLEKYNDAFKNNQIILALAGVNKNAVDSVTEYPTADELDEKRKPLDLYQVLDADSSQQEAIEAAKAGNSIVIQGPPGTGKSQTITNLIAELLANNKKIIFVSEKMAALDVVYNRLQSIGLGDYCIEIHSRKSNKRHVLNQLKDAYESTHPGKPIIGGKMDELIKLRKKLNEYSRVLHTPDMHFNKTPYWFTGELNQISNVEILDIDFSELNNISFEQYEKTISTIETLKERIEMIGHPHIHPFWGCEIKTINEYEQQQISKSLNSFLQKLENICIQIKSFSNKLSIPLIDFSTTILYCKLITVLSEDHKIPKSLLTILDVNKYCSQMEPVLERINLFNSQKGKILEKFKEKIFNEEINEIIELLKTKFKSFWRICLPSYYKTKKRITQHIIDSDNHLSYNEIITNLEDILENLEIKKEIDNTNSKLIDPLFTLWNGIDSNTDAIKATITWFNKYSENRISELDDKYLLEFILNSSSIPDELLQNKTLLEESIPNLITSLGNVLEGLVVNKEILFANGIEKADLSNIDKLLTSWKENIHLLVDWTRYQRAFVDCKNAGLKNYLEKIYSDKTGIEDLIQKFKIVLNENPILKDFEALTQNKIVKKFQELDSFQLELAKNRVLTNLYERKPDSSWKGTKTSQLGYLQRQFRLKRGHHSIRKIFANVPNVVQQLCPCFMMSPLSLSQYINPEKINFDFVIFDEASQISPVDSLGAIIRGNHLVCVGDTKQLPPTTFFDRVAQIEINDENLEDMSTQDLESILDECLTIGMKEFYLKWHYRSRHESLIHFSNINFYKNNLNTFPSPENDTNENGISLVRIEDGIYDRGGNQKNMLEAKTVAKAIFKHYKSNPEKSLGVGTFSQAQQTAILDELEVLRRNDLSLEYFFTENVDESFFVKNLETIQGDERDVIFISVGYGRDQNGKITMNFGPLNKAGGERRLNVLITRAREKVVVYSSITGDDFDLSKTKAIGVQKLKQYLDYARSHGDKSLINHSEDLSGSFDESNIFERSVYIKLLEIGIKVIPQVGYAGYKIDFGILHPDNPSKFILALECDGASYHSSHTARDRDRLRQQVLENLGWRFYRIWSTDWFLNPSREMTKLLNAIKKAKASPLKLSNRLKKTELKVKIVEKSINHNMIGIEIIPYPKYPITNMGEPNMFYYDVEYSYKIITLIKKIITVESPIHLKELCLRIIQHYGMNKVGSKIQLIIESTVKHLNKSGEIVYNNNFLYKTNKPYLKIRTRENSCPVTNIDFVSRDEICNAISLTLSKEISTSRIELVPKVAHIFGYQHTGKKNQDRIKKQISYLLRSKKIRETSFGLELNYIK
jgi:superfamily I DNA and/or RNA helicase/very-short-patch-repair endonuclease